MTEEIKSPERETNLEGDARVREAINLARVKRGMEEKMPVSDLVDEIVKSDWPQPLIDMVTADYNFVKEMTEDENILRRVVEVSYNRVIAGYERNITADKKVPNEAYAMMNAMEKLDALFENPELQPEDLKRVARVSFDLNGLKAVNDLNAGDHKKGDIYLSMALRAIMSDKVKGYAEKEGLKFEPERTTRDGGDEFGVILTSDMIITKDVLEGFVKTVQDSFWDDPEVARILDFSNPNVLASFSGKTKGEVLSEIEEKFGGDIEKYKEANGIPAGYRYRGAISGGGATLYDGLTDNQFDQKNLAKAGDKYSRILQKDAGAMFSSSDRQMEANKKEYKDKLARMTEEDVRNDLRRRGIDPDTIKPETIRQEVAFYHFLAEVYARTDAERELTRQRDALLEENAELKTEIERMKTLAALAEQLISEDKTSEGLALLKKINAPQESG